MRTCATPTVKKNLKTTLKDAGSGRFLMEDGVANRYPVFTSSQLAANRLLFGGFSELLIGMWGVLDLMLDTATNSAKGRLTVRVFQDIDIALRHAEAFCIQT